MNRKVIAGLVVFGIAGAFLMLGAYFFFKASSFYTDYGCVLCPDPGNMDLGKAQVFEIVGGIFGAIGAWLTVTGLKSEHAEMPKQ